LHLFFNFKTFNVRQSIIFRLFLLITLTSLIWSCKKEPDLLGLDLIPEEDLLNHAVIDTITIRAITEREDTLRTDELATMLLGSINDPVFGTTTASVYTQLRLPGTNVSFGTDVVVDSIVLTLPYKGIYGDSSAVQNITVYELDESIQTSVKSETSGRTLDYPYYHFSTLQHKATPVGQFSFVPNTVDSSMLDTVKVGPFMRIPLTLEFANRIVNANQILDSALANNTKFLQAIKGLYITAEPATAPGSGAIMYLNPTHSLSRVHIYYSAMVNNERENKKLELLINENSGRFNHYEHSGYAGADPDLVAQMQGNGASASQKLFLQSMGGTRIKLEFPYLDKLRDKKMAIHEARLVMENAGDDTEYRLPGLIGIRERYVGQDLTTEKYTYLYRAIVDENAGSNYIDGYLNDDKYKLRITRYIQQRLLHPEIEFGPLYLLAAGSALSANRAVIGGPGAEQGKLKLVIYYTPLD